MKFKVFISIFIVAIVILLGSIAVTSGAYFTSKDTVSNEFATGNIDISIIEDFKQPESWDGSNYKKEVSIKNIGKSNCLIRVALVPRWVDESGNPWAGDTSFLQYSFTSNEEGIWIDGDDGYYYYSLKVEKDQVTNRVIDSVAANIPENLKLRYKGKFLVIDVNAEAVQCTKEAHRIMWTTSNNNIKEILDSQCDY